MPESTLPYQEVAAETYPKADPPPDAVTAQPPYEAVKPYLSNKPLRRPARNRLSATRYRSPAAALDEWTLPESARGVIREVLDPASPVGKVAGPVAPAARADASAIRFPAPGEHL